MSPVTNDAAVVMGVAEASRRENVSPTARLWRNLFRHFTVAITFYQRRECAAIRCSSALFRGHFTNAVLSAKSVSSAQRARCSVPFSMSPVTNDAAVVMGVAEASRRENVSPTARLWRNLFRHFTVAITFYQRRECAAIRCSSALFRGHFTNAVLSAKSVSSAQRARCSVPFSMSPVTNDAAVVMGVAEASRRENVSPTARLWRNLFRHFTVAITFYQRRECAAIRCSSALFRGHFTNAVLSAKSVSSAQRARCSVPFSMSPVTNDAAVVMGVAEASRRENVSPTARLWRNLFRHFTVAITFYQRRECAAIRCSSALFRGHFTNAVLSAKSVSSAQRARCSVPFSMSPVTNDAAVVMGVAEASRRENVSPTARLWRNLFRHFTVAITFYQRRECAAIRCSSALFRGHFTNAVLSAKSVSSAQRARCSVPFSMSPVTNDAAVVMGVAEASRRENVSPTARLWRNLFRHFTVAITFYQRRECAAIRCSSALFRGHFTNAVLSAKSVSSAQRARCSVPFSMSPVTNDAAVVMGVAEASRRENVSPTARLWRNLFRHFTVAITFYQRRECAAIRCSSALFRGHFTNAVLSAKSVSSAQRARCSVPFSMSPVTNDAAVVMGVAEASRRENVSPTARLWRNLFRHFTVAITFYQRRECAAIRCSSALFRGHFTNAVLSAKSVSSAQRARCSVPFSMSPVTNDAAVVMGVAEASRRENVSPTARLWRNLFRHFTVAITFYQRRECAAIRCSSALFRGHFTNAVLSAKSVSSAQRARCSVPFSMSPVTNDAAVVMGVAEASRRENVSPTARLWRNLFRHFTVAITFYQRRECAAIRCSSALFRGHFTNAVLSAKSVSSAQRARCSVPFSMSPVTNDAAVVMGVAEASRRENVSPTARLWRNLFRHFTVAITFYQRRECAAIRCSSALFRGHFTNAVLSAKSVSSAQRARCSVPFSMSPVTNDAAVVMAVSDGRCRGISSGKRFANSATVAQSISAFHCCDHVLPTT
jgi:hypothetical protein